MEQLYAISVPTCQYDFIRRFFLLSSQNISGVFLCENYAFWLYDYPLTYLFIRDDYYYESVYLFRRQWSSGSCWMWRKWYSIDTRL